MKTKHVENSEQQKANNEDREEAKDDAGQKDKLGEKQSSVNQRPSRRAKTKEAVFKHLNRDVELLVGDKPDKKVSVKKIPSTTGQTGTTQANGSGGGSAAINAGKRSLSRSGTSMGKNSVPKAQSNNQHTTPFNSMQVPVSIADSKGSTFLESQSQIAPLVSSKTLDQNEENDKKGSNKKTNDKKKPIEVEPVKTRSSLTKQSIKKTTEDENKKSVVRMEDNLDEQGENSSVPEEEELTETEQIDYFDEEGEEENEELPEEESIDPDIFSERASVELKRRRKLALKQEAGKMAAAANRALRIKMGKSGAQAASRKSIKSGKEACQRKLWNQDEDDAIVSLVQKYGTKRWTYIAQMLKDDYYIGGRTGKQCRERWHNHLDPSIKKSPINNEEEIIIFDAHKVYGNKWADIAKLLQGRSDNCIKNYYYSTLRKHIRRINKSLKQCQVAKVLNLKVKTLTADMLFPLVKDNKISYSLVKNIDHKKFEDLEHTMRMIFNHEDGQQVTQRGIIAAAQNRIKIEKQLEEMRERERQEERDDERKRDKKLLNKRRGVDRKNPESRKRQKLNYDETDSEDPNGQSSQEDINMASEDEETQPKITQTDALNSQMTSQNQNETKENFSSKKNKSNIKMPVLKNKMSSFSEVEGNAALKSQNSMSFPKGLQLKPNVSKKQNALKPPNLSQNLKLADSNATPDNNLNDERQTSGNEMCLKQLALGGNFTSGSGRQSPSQAHNVFKNSLGDVLNQRSDKMGVTENEDDVTKTNFDNRFNCSENKQQLQQQERGSQKIKKKKDKKKKKHKDKESKRFGYQSNLYSGLSGLPPGSTLTNVDEIADQYDQQTIINQWNQFANRMPSQNLADVLALTSKKQSASKIYPGFYDHMHYPKIRKDQQMNYGGSGPTQNNTTAAIAGVGGHGSSHTCSFSGTGHLSHFPPSYMFQTPYYMGPLYPFHPMGSAGPMFHPDAMKSHQSRGLEKQKNSKSSNKDIDQKKQEHSCEKKHEVNKDEEGGSSENKIKKDEHKEKHQESQNENHFMSHEAMNHYFALTTGQMHPGQMALPPHLHSLYQKSGHVPPHMMPAHHGMPFYPFTGIPMPPHQYQPRERQTHHASAYHKQFTMPITPNNLQQQVFGAEKQLQFLADSTGGPSQQQKQQKKAQVNPTPPEECSQEKDKKELGDKKLLTSKLGLTKRSSSADNLHGQRQSMLQQPAQFNSNITLMINHFGLPPGQATQEQQNEDSKGIKRTQERSEQLSPSKKQGQNKKHEQNTHPGANSNVSFKQSFKPQRIDTLQKKFQEAMTSRGVTPNNQGPHPLISASNLLLSHNMFGHAAGAGGLYHIPGLQGSQQTATNNKKDNPTLQNRLFAGTPRLFLGQNLSSLQQKNPTSTTAAAAAAAASQNEYLGSGLLLQSQRNMNSGHTFNASGAFGGGSRINTKTHAQQQANAKGGNTLITPKVNTVGSDPETHRKLLEKMFQNTNNQDSGETAPVNLISTTGGAFTKKQGVTPGGGSTSKDGSNRGNSQNNQSQSQTKQLKKGAQNSGESISLEQSGLKKEKQKHQHQQIIQPFQPERDSIGLLYVNPSQLVLEQDQDPIAQMYTDAPVSKLQFDEQLNSSQGIQTPLLGAMRGTKTKEREHSQSPDHEDKHHEADSILDESVQKGEVSDAEMHEDTI